MEHLIRGNLAEMFGKEESRNRLQVTLSKYEPKYQNVYDIQIREV